ncbi:MAG: universal stress protein [Alphaproteobacteria bacterium]|nr:universal stress protein [Alphaproteobacteria bacterium]
MIKTILVPSSGSQADDRTFASALIVARALGAHLEVLHVRPDAAAMVASMATDGSGAAMTGGLVERIDEEVTRREDNAKQLFQRFCEREGLPVAETPASGQGPTAQWRREVGDEAYWVREYGRAADLIAVGCPSDDQGVSIDTTEAALVGSGRPVLMLPATPLVSLPETIVIAWKAAPEAARAVTAAMPLLAKAKQILIVTVTEEQGLSDEEGARLKTSFSWHGLNASTRHLRPDRLGAAETLLAAAAEAGALVVMGAYGHSRLRQWIFGGFTQHVLRGAPVPVLMMH